MLVDGRKFKAGEQLSATVCIVGGGPAGLTLARELGASGTDVIVLESGGTTVQTEAQKLNEGRVIGSPYAGLRQTRRRQLGGAVNTWNTPFGDQVGAKYVPLDPWDFASRNTTAIPGWPIAYPDLVPFYGRAHTFCGLRSGGRNSVPPHCGPPFELKSGRFTSRAYEFGPASQFLRFHVDALRGADNVRICTNVTVSHLNARSASRIADVMAITPLGATVCVNAMVFILAAGAIENARLLLISRSTVAGLLDDRWGWIGRCFMEHPRDTALTLIPDSPALFERAKFYDTHTVEDGAIYCGRIALADGALPARGLPNMSITLLPRERSSGISGWMRRSGLSRSKAGYGWSMTRDPWRYFDAFRLLINLEQRPQRENYITLSGACVDALGQARTELHWSWTAREQAELGKLLSLIADEFDASKLGTVQIEHGRLPDPNAHHHAGTTRMSKVPEFGVVDPDARVHGIDNLYIAGSSIFPTAGFANPTLTIVAMSARLAEHILRRI